MPPPTKMRRPGIARRAPLPDPRGERITSMVRSLKANAGTEATVFGPAISTWPMVSAKKRVTSSTKSGSVLPSQGSWPLQPELAALADRADAAHVDHRSSYIGSGRQPELGLASPSEEVRTARGSGRPPRSVTSSRITRARLRRSAHGRWGSRRSCPSRPTPARRSHQCGARSSGVFSVFGSSPGIARARMPVRRGPD